MNPCIHGNKNSINCVVFSSLGLHSAMIAISSLITLSGFLQAEKVAADVLTANQHKVDPTQFQKAIIYFNCNCRLLMIPYSGKAGCIRSDSMFTKLTSTAQVWRGDDFKHLCICP